MHGSKNRGVSDTASLMLDRRSGERPDRHGAGSVRLVSSRRDRRVIVCVSLCHLRSQLAAARCYGRPDCMSGMRLLLLLFVSGTRVLGSDRASRAES